MMLLFLSQVQTRVVSKRDYMVILGHLKRVVVDFSPQPINFSYLHQEEIRTLLVHKKQTKHLRSQTVLRDFERIIKCACQTFCNLWYHKLEVDETSLPA